MVPLTYGHLCKDYGSELRMDLERSVFFVAKFHPCGE